MCFSFLAIHFGVGFLIHYLLREPNFNQELFSTDVLPNSDLTIEKIPSKNLDGLKSQQNLLEVVI
ncbi:MAG: hypothetical protein U0X86_001299 [Wolbachia endosymbiont of Xenopsylla cheopis]